MGGVSVSVVGHYWSLQDVVDRGVGGSSHSGFEDGEFGGLQRVLSPNGSGVPETHTSRQTGLS